MGEAGGSPTQGGTCTLWRSHRALGTKLQGSERGFELQAHPRPLGSSCRSASGLPGVVGSQAGRTKFTSPLSATNPGGSGGVPRPTSSQGAHKRSPFSRNTHLPGEGGAQPGTAKSAQPLLLPLDRQWPCLPPQGLAEGSTEVDPGEGVGIPRAQGSLMEARDGLAQLNRCPDVQGQVTSPLSWP